MEHILDKEKMDSIKALADTNMQISAAKGTLFQLQATETEYLEGREKKAMERIQKVVEDSHLLIKEAKENYQEIVDMSKSAAEVSKSLSSLHESFQKTLLDFEERNVLWGKQIENQQKEIADMRKGLQIEKMNIENDRTFIEKAKASVKLEERKIKDKWAEYERAIIRLKEGRI